jgi:putative PEP-CTERM system TPR-repeat lipoprotein
MFQMSIVKRIATVLSFGLLVAALSGCEPTPEERVSRAEAFMADHDYRSAVLELKNAARANPDYGYARFLLGKTSYQLGDLNTAIDEFERALGLGEDRPEVWVALGRALTKTGQAREAFERVMPNLDEESSMESVHVLRGDIYSVLNNWEEADSAYKAALALNENSAGGLVGSAQIKSIANDHDNAVALLSRAAEKNPNSPMVWRAFGNYWVQRGEPDKGSDALSRSLEAESAETPDWDRFVSRVALATMYLDTLRDGQAEDILQNLKQTFPPHPIMRYLQGRLAYIRQDYELAQGELQEYLASTPRDRRGQAILGAVHFARDNYRQAEMYLSQAVKADIGGETTRRLLAETLLRLDKPGEALTELKRSETFGKQDSGLLALLGRTQIDLGATEEGISSYQEALSIEPDSYIVKMSLAAAYLQSGRVDDALNLLQLIENVPPNDFRRETLMMGAFLQKDEEEEAANVASKLLDDNPGSAKAHSLAAVLFKSIGQAERARDLLNKALDLDPVYKEALFQLGVLEYESNNLGQSRVYLEKVRDLQPDNFLTLAS